MRKKAVAIGAGLLIIATAAIIVGMAPGKSPILDPVPGVTYVSREQALRKPFIDWNTPFGRWTLPAPVRGLDDAKSRLRKQPNLTGLLVFSGNMLDMMPRMKLDGVEYPLQSDSQWTAQYIFLPTVYGTKSKEATITYGDLRPFRVELPASGSPAPAERRKSVDVGPYQVELKECLAPFKLPRPQFEVSFQGGRPEEILSLHLFTPLRPLKAGVREWFDVAESELKASLPISIQSVTSESTTLTVSRVSDRLLMRDSAGRWRVEAKMDPARSKVTVGDPAVLGWIHIPGLPVGAADPADPAKPALPPGYLPDPWPQLRALKDGQKLPATIYRPSGKPIVSSIWIE